MRYTNAMLSRLLSSDFLRVFCCTVHLWAPLKSRKVGIDPAETQLLPSRKLVLFGHGSSCTRFFVLLLSTSPSHFISHSTTLASVHTSEKVHTVLSTIQRVDFVANAMSTVQEMLCTFMDDATVQYDGKKF